MVEANDDDYDRNNCDDNFNDNGNVIENNSVGGDYSYNRFFFFSIIMVIVILDYVGRFV